VETGGSAQVFALSCTLACNLHQSCKSKLVTAKRDIDVICMHEHLPAKTKFDTISVFCKNVSVSRFDPRVLVGTASTNLGVRCPNAIHTTNMEWIDNISSWIQRMGRGSRNDKPAVTILVAGIPSYTNTHMPINHDHHLGNNNATEEFLAALLSLLRAPQTQPH
jgi:superfamily II DNA/RNA helicase